MAMKVKVVSLTYNQVFGQSGASMLMDFFQ